MPIKTTVDSELFQLIRDRLFTPVLGDILDRERYWHQFLPQPIKPSHSSHRIVGHAYPVRIATSPVRNAGAVVATECTTTSLLFDNRAGLHQM